MARAGEFHLLLLCLLGCWSLARGVDLASPLVFDAEFYVNSQSLWNHGVRTADAAKYHWLTKGLDEGLQGCGNFHSKQYLLRYPDLVHAFGHNYKKAVEHYLTFGQTERRLGYVEGGYGGRWTISNGHDLFISASGRMAGAVDSLVWNHKEFINAFDHGRELQMATNSHPWGECLNPTEAGGRDDGAGANTKSQLKGIKAHGKILETTVHPAFWLRPGDHEVVHHNYTGPCSDGAPPLKKNVTYPYPLSKRVTIGCAGLDHCVKFESSFTIAGPWPQTLGYNFEAPTGYLTGEFKVLQSMNPHTFHLSKYVPSPPSPLPIMLSTPDHQHAMAVWAPARQDTDSSQYYAGFNFGPAFASGTNKWTVVFRKNAFAEGSSHTLHYVVYICVGDVNAVVSCLRKVILTYPHV